MEKIMVFLDYANLNQAAADHGYALDYGQLLAYLSESRFLIDAYSYVPIDPRCRYARDGLIDALWKNGYLVRSKLGSLRGDICECPFSVEITLDLLRVAYNQHPDVIVLASGDPNYLPVALALRKQGIRVEIAAFPDKTNMDLIRRCSGFIDLSRYNQEIHQSAKPASITGNPIPAHDSTSDAARIIPTLPDCPEEPPYSALGYRLI